MEKNKNPKEYEAKNSMFNLTVKATKEEDEDYVLNFVGSSETPDRHGDIVKSDSWILDSYKKNPVFLWGHNHHELPVGKALDVKVNNKEKRLEFKIKFAVEEYPFAKTVYKLYKGGYLAATSVGFIPHAFDYDEEKEAFILSDNELLELSAVTVPANPDALALGFSKGLFDDEDMKGMKQSGLLSELKKGLDEETKAQLTKDVEEGTDETPEPTDPEPTETEPAEKEEPTESTELTTSTSNLSISGIVNLEEFSLGDTNMTQYDYFGFSKIDSEDTANYSISFATSKEVQELKELVEAQGNIINELKELIEGINTTGKDEEDPKDDTEDPEPEVDKGDDKPQVTDPEPDVNETDETKDKGTDPEEPQDKELTWDEMVKLAFGEQE